MTIYVLSFVLTKREFLIDNSNPRIHWTPLSEPQWDRNSGVEYPCAMYYGKHFLVRICIDLNIIYIAINN